MKAVFKTDRGRVRPHNEDNGGIFETQNNLLLAVVADGMGGHRAGDVASEMAVKQLQELWEQSSLEIHPEEAEKWLTEAIQKVNNHIFVHASKNEECQGMGTTMVAAVCSDSFATVANIGDSRCYIFNELGFSQFTEDHTLVNELVRSGHISRQDAEHHPRKNVILRALGTEEHVIVDVKTITFEQGDCLLLCSDGLSNKVSDVELKQILESEQRLEEKAEQLINLANENGGEDNITIVIVKNDEEAIRNGESS
ncbi:MAG TPA: Stp1/IreP family PP2C-type Ser/Thr phosphatase [Bacillus sp. (in: firmicutes)]|uniref:Stp1/IreP family PP2C-type Ser/Thr phosphatase n=1 Tax=Bacillus litorisediminis TaxID=2922713 RepID=UPI001FABD7E3|nr:Stp1/IreP family PP2C-type Ser/Thr phosphatase [Bacillus litorisediminis]HWO77907.1 Stp1/IreP family PP2C-type Ser/Thr phosphatase [Bacillus sp. (in: firmicutes)]